MSISEKIIERLKAEDVPFKSNDNIGNYVSEEELAELLQNICGA